MGSLSKFTIVSFQVQPKGRFVTATVTLTFGNASLFLPVALFFSLSSQFLSPLLSPSQFTSCLLAPHPLPAPLRHVYISSPPTGVKRKLTNSGAGGNPHAAKIPHAPGLSQGALSTSVCQGSNRSSATGCWRVRGTLSPVCQIGRASCRERV